MPLVEWEPEFPWNASKFKVKKDDAWAAGCRWLSSWWRESLRFQPGERSDMSESLVGWKLPFKAEAEDNFFGPKVVKAVENRLFYGSDDGIVPSDQLFRDLLESQTMCFNLFGEFWAEPNELLGWVQSLDPQATAVLKIEFEALPEKKEHIGGGTGIDALIDYEAGTTTGTAAGDPIRRFLAVELKYAEVLDEQKLTIKPVHRDTTEANGHWRAAASRRLDRNNLRQFWITTLVAQSIADKTEDYDAGRVVVMTGQHDHAALLAVNLVRNELVEPDDSLVWSPIERLVDSVADRHPEWAAWFRRRYLDFTPVLDMLAEDDPRRAAAKPKAVTGDGLRDLFMITHELNRDGGTLEHLVEMIETGNLTAKEIIAFDTRARELAADLTAFRQSLGEKGV